MKKLLALILPLAALSLNAAEVRTAGGIVYSGAVEYTPATVIVTSASGQKKTFTLDELDATSAAKLLPKGNPYETIGELEKKLKASADVYAKVKKQLELAIKLAAAYRDLAATHYPLVNILEDEMKEKNVSEEGQQDYHDLTKQLLKAYGGLEAIWNDAQGIIILPEMDDNIEVVRPRRFQKK